MDEFVRRPPEDRLIVISTTATRRGIIPAIIEKDFWVCWTLRRLYENQALGPHMTFKGGTSLSKGYGVIDRFSEDIDLTIGRTASFICDTLPPMEHGIGTNEVGRRAKAVTAAAEQFVREIVLPELRNSISASLGSSEGWAAELADEDKQTILFHYPRLVNYGAGYGTGAYGAGRYGEGAFGYIKPTIKLEFGARGEIEPNEQRTIVPYVAESFPNAFASPETALATLSAERTFWEKLTILHALHHNAKMRDRMSRHYYDVHMLTAKGVAAAAMKAPELLGQVVRNKKLLWRDASASYDTAVFGSLKLVPQAGDMATLKRDYELMQPMFMAEPPEFEAILETLRELEALINGGNGEPAK